MTRSVLEEIRWVDRQMLKFVGLMNDPQARELADRMLDRRLLLMLDRDRGFRTVDRRRVRR
jgi:hypothetical protein